MNVILGGNIKKESARIDINGNILNKQGQVVELAEVPYKPTPDELAKMANAPTEMLVDEIKKESPKSKIDELINSLVSKKIEEIIAKKVEEALSKL